MKADQKRSSSFLERFEGRRATISKEGLLHLFDHHHHSRALPQPPPDTLTDRRDLQRLASDLRPHKEPASRLSHRTEVLRETGKDDFVLPRIGPRFSSSHQKLLPRHDEGKRTYLQLEKPKRTSGVAAGRQLDENALEHLEFLNKLEETLAGLRAKK